MQLDQVFGQRLFKTLLWEAFPQDQIERMLDACRTVRFTRSNNRSVLGSMNDIRFQIDGACRRLGECRVGGLAPATEPHALQRYWLPLSGRRASGLLDALKVREPRRPKPGAASVSTIMAQKILLLWNKYASTLAPNLKKVYRTRNTSPIR
ncbi:MAG: DUF6933 domain-containing protein [Gammaproteobacteria bacterium]